METVFEPRDMYMRYTDRDGHRFVQVHRVYDSEKFLASMQEAHRKAGGSAEQITSQEYKNER